MSNNRGGLLRWWRSGSKEISNAGQRSRICEKEISQAIVWAQTIPPCR